MKKRVSTKIDLIEEYHHFNIKKYGSNEIGLTDDEIKVLFRRVFDKKSSQLYKKFNRWINGQTCGCSDDLKIIYIYRWDVDRFIRNVLYGDYLIFD